MALIKMKNMRDLVTCTKCGWVSFSVTRAYAEKAVREFNEYYHSLSKKDQASFGGPSSVTEYVCPLCGGNSFKPAKDGDCPNGCTVRPVIID